MNEVSKSQQKYFYQYVATAAGTLAMITSGMHFGWPSPSLPQLLSNESTFPITSSDGSWVAVMPCIGAPPGALFGAFVVDRIGRKTSMLIVSPVYFITWLVIAYTPNLLFLNVARFVVGIMDGMTFTILPIYIGEISSPRIRGFLGCSIMVTFVLGFLLINLLGLYYSIKTTALVSSIVPVMHFATFFWMPESPYYYLTKNNIYKASLSLQKLTGVQNADEMTSKLNVEKSVEPKQGFRRYLNLFSDKGNRKSLTIVLGLRLIQQFTGNSTIAFYCLIVFKEAGGLISERAATLLYFSVQLFGSVVSSFLVDKTGRRPLLIISVAGSGVALAVQGVYFYLKQDSKVDISRLGYLPLAALLFYNLLFNIGLSTIPILVLGEYFPTDVKALAVSLADVFYGAVIVVASKFFQIVNDEFGMYFPFITFALCCAVGLVFIVVYIPETKGKTLEEIQKELKGIITKHNSRDIELKGVEKPLINN